MVRDLSVRLPALLSFLLLSLLPLAAQAQTPNIARKATDFLQSIGANSAISTRGETLENTIKEAKYLGLGWIRSGYEGNVPIQDMIELHLQTGTRFSYGLLSGGTDIPRLLEGARQLARAGALVALEGPNEPNNWGVTYQGEAGGGKAPSWMAVAKLQRDLYRAVKSDPALKKYPVWSISENGAEADNVGLQFLTIPQGAHCLMPDGTKYADFANVHNYIYHPSSPGLADNRTWNAADPSPACRVDGLYGNYGTTWGHHYAGYSQEELATLPKVTTETGTTIGEDVTEEIHARNLLTMYLDQFKRGTSYTAVYLLRDRVDEGGNQKFGFFAPDHSPRKAALYLHNLTTILADPGSLTKPQKLNYTLPNEPETVHDMLLQKSDGTFELIVWGEKVTGTSEVMVDLGGTHKSVMVYDPTIGTDPTQTLSNVKSLPMTLSDHPLVIEVK